MLVTAWSSSSSSSRRACLSPPRWASSASPSTSSIPSCRSTGRSVRSPGSTAPTCCWSRSRCSCSWRDHPAGRHRPADVQRGGAVALLAAGRADARQHRLLRDLRRHFGLQCGLAATIGTVALPEVKRRGYNERLFLGTLAAGGIGILIPPSINLIIYGLLTDTSVPELYLAGFIPGAVLAGLFMLTTIIACLYRPEWGGERMMAPGRSAAHRSDRAAADLHRVVGDLRRCGHTD